MKRRILVFAAAAFVFASCQKEVDPGTDPVNDVKYISRLVQTEPGYPGEASVMEFEYDAQNRVTKINDMYYDTVGGVAQVADEYHYIFHYNGTGTTPTKITESVQGISWFMKFDSQGKKLQDSVVDPSGGGTEVVNYTYATNKIMTETIFDLSGATLMLRDTVEFNNSNFVKQKFATYFNGNLESIWEQTLTYDDKQNPLSKLNISSTFFASAYIEMGTFLGLNKNNFTSLTERDVFDPLNVETTQYRYTYDADNYPTKIEYLSGGTIRYEYK